MSKRLTRLCVLAVLLTALAVVPASIAFAETPADSGYGAEIEPGG
jgi:hypothetical protein